METMLEMQEKSIEEVLAGHYKGKKTLYNILFISN